MSRRVFVPFLLFVLVAACGDPGGPTDRVADDASTGFPVTLRAPNGNVTLTKPAERIVSLSATATESLFAIDAGDLVVAVDDQSNHPKDAPKTDLSGLQPNIEAIAEHEPDLVVMANDANDAVKSLTELEIPVLLQPAATKLADAYAQIEQLGRATGRVREASDVVAAMKSRVRELVRSVPRLEEKPTYYHELDQNYFSVTSKTFIGQIYALAGLENIADAAKGAETGYPQLSAEYIVQADPDVIFLADAQLGQTPQKVAQRPGWNRIAAVRSGSVVALDADIASRWGPRLVEFLEVVVGEVTQLEQDAA